MTLSDGLALAANPIGSASLSDDMTVWQVALASHPQPGARLGDEVQVVVRPPPFRLAVTPPRMSQSQCAEGWTSSAATCGVATCTACSSAPDAHRLLVHVGGEWRPWPPDSVPTMHWLPESREAVAVLVGLIAFLGCLSGH